MCLLIHGHLRRFGRVDHLEFRIQFPLEYADIVGSNRLQNVKAFFETRASYILPIVDGYCNYTPGA